MFDKPEARVIIKSGHRADLASEINVYDPRKGRMTRLGITAGPRREDVEREVRKVAAQLERAGNRVTFKEM